MAENISVRQKKLQVCLSMFSSTDGFPSYPLQYHVLKEVDGMSSETMLLLWSMREKHNCNSKFKIYFDSLPEKFNTGIVINDLCLHFFFI